MDQHHPHMEGIARACNKVGLVPGGSSSITEPRVKPFPPKDLNVTISEYKQALEAASNAFPGTEYTLVGTVMALESLPTLLLICWTKPHPLLARIGSIICFSVPVHPANKPSLSRWEHASQLKLPVCLITGERDPLAYEGNLAELFSKLPTRTKQLSIIPVLITDSRQPKTMRISHEAFSVAGEALTSFLASLE